MSTIEILIAVTLLIIALYKLKKMNDAEKLKTYNSDMEYMLRYSEDEEDSRDVWL